MTRNKIPRNTLEDTSDFQVILFFFVVLQNWDRPFLLRDACRVLVHVRDVAEMGHMFGHQPFHAHLTELSAHGHIKVCSCFGTRTSLQCSLSKYISKASLCFPQRLQRVSLFFQFLPSKSGTLHQNARAPSCQIGGAWPDILHVNSK